MKHTFRNRALLEQALTHTSFSAEARVPSNQRLEFLGDAALKLLVAELLYRRFPDWPEGNLSTTLGRLVGNAHLAKLARAAQLGEALRLGRGARNMADADRENVLADAFEAVIGAVFEDAGFDAVRAEFGPVFEAVIAGMDGPAEDPKSRLQEREQKAGRAVPDYRTIREEGRDHTRVWVLELTVNGRSYGPVSGKSKKAAQVELASLALADRG